MRSVCRCVVAQPIPQVQMDCAVSRSGLNLGPQHDGTTPACYVCPARTKSNKRAKVDSLVPEMTAD